MLKKPWYKREINILPVSTVDIVTMTQNLAVMIKAGVTVPEALDTLVEQFGGRVKSILRRVNEDVQSGELLGSAMEKEVGVFGPIFVSSVKIGESTGTLSENLTHLSEQMEKDLEVRRNVQGAMLYPGIIISATLILGLAMATFVLPQMAGIFSSLDVELPLTTRVVMWLADKFQKNGYILSPAILILALAFVVLVRQRFMDPIVHRVVLKIPVINSFVHDINRARFTRMLSTMLQSGVPIQEALEIGGNVLPNYVYRMSVRDMRNKIESGESFADIISSYPKLYPKMVQRMIAIGESSGSIGETLAYLSRFYEQKVAIKAKSLSTVIEPLLLILIGLCVGFVALAIFTPIYSVTEGLNL
jgi:type II secretory pathway component PulF